MPTCGKHSTVLSSNHHHHCIGSVLVYFNPVTGSQYEREVVFNFLCDPEVDGVETLCARQNSPLTATTLFCSRRRRLVPVTAMWRC